MNLLVISAHAIAGTGRSIPRWECAEKLGQQITFYPNVPVIKPDAIISMSVSVMEETWLLMERFPDVPVYSYLWDCYEWVWKNPRPGEYDYRKYGQLLRKSREVWVPSDCTAVRANQWWSIKNSKVILSSVPYWEHGNVRDGGYALCCLREIPDPWWGVFERVCDGLGIPYVTTLHSATYEQYQDTVAGCRFMVSPLYELSTGGLSLLEGYYHGKPCLLSDSEWHGGIDYLGNRAVYFKYGDEEDFANKLEMLYRNPPQLSVRNCKEFVRQNYGDEGMVKAMIRRITATR